LRFLEMEMADRDSAAGGVLPPAGAPPPFHRRHLTPEMLQQLAEAADREMEAEALKAWMQYVRTLGAQAAEQAELRRLAEEG
jgi:hypothetical protein